MRIEVWFAITYITGVIGITLMYLAPYIAFGLSQRKYSCKQKKGWRNE